MMTKNPQFYERINPLIKLIKLWSSESYFLNNLISLFDLKKKKKILIIYGITFIVYIHNNKNKKKKILKI